MTLIVIILLWNLPISALFFFSFSSSSFSNQFFGSRVDLSLYCCFRLAEKKNRKFQDQFDFSVVARTSNKWHQFTSEPFWHFQNYQPFLLRRISFDQIKVELSPRTFPRSRKIVPVKEKLRRAEDIRDNGILRRWRKDW